MAEALNVLTKVCSDKVRAGGSWATSDIFHVTSDGTRTVCGIKCDEWIRMGEIEDGEFASAYFCARCHKRSFDK